MHKTIVVAIDLSHAEKAEAMIDVARKLADRGQRIVLTYVIEEIPTPEYPNGVVDKSKQMAIRDLETIAQTAGLDADIEVRRGQAHIVILAVAEEKGAVTIVIASHRPGLQDYLLGSTALRVVRHAMCSVHIVR